MLFDNEICVHLSTDSNFRKFKTSQLIKVPRCVFVRRSAAKLLFALWFAISITKFVPRSISSFSHNFRAIVARLPSPDSTSRDRNACILPDYITFQHRSQRAPCGLCCAMHVKWCYAVLCTNDVDAVATAACRWQSTTEKGDKSIKKSKVKIRDDVSERRISPISFHENFKRPPMQR